jgi:hypothetical protein
MKAGSGSMMTFTLMGFDMKEEELGQFLNWFLKHYSTACKMGVFFYMNSMEKEVSIREIVDEYLVKIYTDNLPKPVKKQRQFRKKAE